MLSDSSVDYAHVDSNDDGILSNLNTTPTKIFKHFIGSLKKRNKKNKEKNKLLTSKYRFSWEFILFVAMGNLLGSIVYRT